MLVLTSNIGDTLARQLTQFDSPGISPEELQKKREEAERKARRGEIDPMHEFAFQVIGQVRICL